MILKNLRIRQLIQHIPFLDGLRLSFLAWFCNHGSEFIGDSYQITRVFSPAAREHIKHGRPAIYALYHGRMVGILGIISPRHKLTILISQSRDGEIIARAITDIGFTVARGSPARGAVEGGLQLIKASQAGQSLALMVDGPRGPAHTVKSGIIRIAEITGLPIIPFVCTARSAWRMWGWDRFMVPCWGGPVIYIYGDPIAVSLGISDGEREMLRGNLEVDLDKLRKTAGSLWKGTEETSHLYLHTDQSPKVSCKTEAPPTMPSSNCPDPNKKNNGTKHQLS